MTTRTDLINFLIQKLGFKSYLEIGIQSPAQNFDKITCEKKQGVEPNYLFEGCVRMTSDQFFAIGWGKFDLIFIDGDHSCVQSYRDIVNALNFVTEKGLIVCHDVLPPDVNHTNPYQNGEVYKAVANFRNTYHYQLWTWNNDFGCGVIAKHIKAEKSNVMIESFTDYLNNKKVYNIIEDADIIVSACLR